MKLILPKAILLPVFGLLASVAVAQTGPHIQDDFTASKTYMDWTVATSGATSTQDATTGIITVTPAPVSGKYRGDFKKTASSASPVYLNKDTYPIVAIKFSKPATCNLTFDTSLGAYGNGANKYMQISTTDGRNVYYWDLAATGAFFQSPNGKYVIADMAQPFSLTSFQFKIADIVAATQPTYDIEWVESFASLNDLMARVASVLPVSLTSFSASALPRGAAQLNWKTGSEANNSYFVLERKVAEGDFREIGRVGSKGDQGAYYSYLDEAPASGINFYRLSQVDKDGKKTELGVRSVELSLTNSAVVLYPNPLKGRGLYVKSNVSGLQHLKITDMSGRVLFQKAMTAPDSGELYIELPSKPAAGIYLLSLNGTKVQKLIVE